MSERITEARLKGLEGWCEAARYDGATLDALPDGILPTVRDVIAEVRRLRGLIAWVDAHWANRSERAWGIPLEEAEPFEAEVRAIREEQGNA